MVEPATQAVAKGAKKQKVASEEYSALAPEQWPVRPYLEKFVAPLLMEAMQVRLVTAWVPWTMPRLEVRNRMGQWHAYAVDVRKVLCSHGQVC